MAITEMEIKAPSAWYYYMMLLCLGRSIDEHVTSVQDFLNKCRNKVIIKCKEDYKHEMCRNVDRLYSRGLDEFCLRFLYMCTKTEQ